MAIQSKLISLGAQIIGSKGGRKAAAVGGEFTGGILSNKGVRTLASTPLKTTSQFSSVVSPALSGGKIIKKGVANFATGIGGSSKLFGSLILPVGGGLGAVYAGNRIWDSIGDVNAKTQSLREYDMALKLADEETRILAERMDKELEFNQSFLDMEIAKQAAFKAGDISSEMLTQAGGMAGDALRLKQITGGGVRETANGESGGSALFALLGIGLLGGSAYYFSKKKKK